MEDNIIELIGKWQARSFVGDADDFTYTSIEA